MNAFTMCQYGRTGAKLSCYWLVGLGSTIAVAGYCMGVQTVHEEQVTQKQREPPFTPKESENSAPDDLVCGPRCVQYLLQYYYGQETDLIELVREIQWPDMESGASLDVIDRALSKRGVHTFGMQLAPNARLKWPYPTLIHLKVPGAKVGHYAVWLPSRSGKPKVWCGLIGVQRMSERKLAERATGAVLLTAPENIRNPDAAVERIEPSASIWVWCVGGCVCTLFVAALAGKYMSRRFSVLFNHLSEVRS